MTVCEELEKPKLKPTDVPDPVLEMLANTKTKNGTTMWPTNHA